MMQFTHAWPWRYGVAIGASLVALLLRIELGSQLDSSLLFLAAVIFSAWYGGLWPGLLATLLGALACASFFLPPAFPPAVTGLKFAVGFGEFVLVALFISWLDTARAARRRMEAQRLAAETAQQHFRGLVHGLDAIVWEADPATSRFTFVSRRAEEVLGFPVERWLVEPDFWVNLVHPADRAWVVGFCQTATREGRDHDFEYRAVAADGRVVWLHAVVRVVLNEAGHPVHLRGVMVDVTARKHAEEEIRREKTFSEMLITSSVDGILAFDRECRYTVWNPGMERISGIGKSEALGRIAFDVFPFLKETGEDRYFSDALAGRTVVAKDRPYTVPETGRQGFFEGYYAPLQSAAGEVVGGLGIIRDITERKRAEEAQHFLAEATGALAASLDYEATVESVARLTVPRLADWCAVDMVEDDGSVRRLAVAHVDPSKVALVRALQHRAPLDPDSPAGVSTVLRTGTSVLLSEIPDSLAGAVARDADHLRILRALGFQSAMCVPLVAHGRTLGAITLGAARAERRYGTADLALAEDLACRAAIAIENARLHRQTQEAVEQREESLALLDTLLRTAPVGLAFFDRELRHVRINDSLAAMDGIAPEEHLGRTIREVIPKLAPLLEPRLCRVFETGQPMVGLEVSGETPATPGERRHWLASYYPVPGRDGQLLGVGAVVVEITERKRAEEERSELLDREQRARAAAEAAQRRLAFLAEASTVLASSLDQGATLTSLARLVLPDMADFCIVDVVQADQSLHQVAVAHVDPTREKWLHELRRRYPPDPSRPHPILEVLRSGRAVIVPETPESLHLELARDDRHIELIRALGFRSHLIVPLIAHGRILGTISFVSATTGRYSAADLTLAEDLARRAALAVDNARLYREAQEAVRLRDEFLSSVSHDLKNPLGCIKGQAQLLKRRLPRSRIPETERLVEGLTSIDATATKMAAMLNELLDVARLQMGQPLALHRRPTDLVELARQAAAEHQHTTERHCIRVETDLASLVGEWDAARLERVLGNLLANAIKYSPAGGHIAVRVAREDEPAGAWGVVAVQDQGLGIPAADLPYVFQRFHRGENVLGRIAGTGIGLAGARQIVEQHSGTIAARSTEGAGATFTVRLPLAVTDDAVA